MKGFFPASRLIKPNLPVSTVPLCGACGFYKTCQSPKMEVAGKGKKGILILGESPGKEEDRQGIPFVGNSGKLMTAVLRQWDVSLDRDCWRSNALICRPPEGTKPQDKHIGYCRPNLTSIIRNLKPRLVIALGQWAIKSVLMGIWREDVGGPIRWSGHVIPNRNPNMWICPMLHPAYVLRETDKRNPVPEMMFRRQIETACSLKGRPWKGEIEDLSKMVEVIKSPEKAERAIGYFKAGNAAFDYETNMKKPYHASSEIISCSISDGDRTIAFPWNGRVRDAMYRFIRSKSIGKIASNIAFEEVWTRKEYGVGVRNWVLCTMNMAHVIDNRKRASGLKFQSFVRFGIPDYSYHIQPFMESEKGKLKNRIRTHVDLDDLLVYNGLDSLLEYRLAMRQMEEFGLL